jgi:hypothetical protein
MELWELVTGEKCVPFRISHNIPPDTPLTFPLLCDVLSYAFSYTLPTLFKHFDYTFQPDFDPCFSYTLPTLFCALPYTFRDIPTLSFVNFDYTFRVFQPPFSLDFDLCFSYTTLHSTLDYHTYTFQ